MTIVACLLTVGIVCMYFSHQRDIRLLIEEHGFERERNDDATSKLLDRIQHPAVRQVEPGEVKEYDPPADAGELAQVGLVVPEFVNVGENGAS